LVLTEANSTKWVATAVKPPIRIWEVMGSNSDRGLTPLTNISGSVHPLSHHLMIYPWNFAGESQKEKASNFMKDIWK